MLYFVEVKSAQDIGNAYTNQVNNNWIPYAQAFILLLASAALLSRLIK